MSMGFLIVLCFTQTILFVTAIILYRRHCKRIQLDFIRTSSAVENRIIQRILDENLTDIALDIMSIFTASVVFVGEFVKENKKLKVHALISHGKVSNGIEVDLQEIPFKSTKVWTLVELDKSDLSLLDKLHITSAKYSYVIPLICNDNDHLGVIALLFNRKSKGAMIVNSRIINLYTMCICKIIEKTKLRHFEHRKVQHLYDEKKMECVGTFAGCLAHDLNNQLNAILGYSDLLQRKLSQKTHLQKYLDGIVLSVNVIADLTEKLMVFARNGKNVAIIVNIHDLLEGLIESLYSCCSEYRIQIVKRLSATDLLVKGDPGLLKIIFNNIAQNAIESMSLGGQLFMTTSNLTLESSQIMGEEKPAEVASGTYVVISFRDTGTGMNSDEIGHLFEPFYTNKKSGKCAGFGLATVWGSLKSHHGYIDVSSKIGNGTNVNVYLPVC